MHCFPFWVYKLENGPRRLRFRISPIPRLDAAYWQERGAGSMTVLSPPLSLGEAEALAAALQRTDGNLRGEVRLLRRAWQEAGQQLPHILEQVEPLPTWQGQEEARNLLGLLRGRILLFSEVERAVASARLFLAHPLLELLHFLYLEESITCQAAIALVPGQGCRRCGGTDLVATTCLSCGAEGWLCRDCSALGQARTCIPLYGIPASQAKQPRGVELALPHPLTLPQQAAARQLEEFYHQKKVDTCLFWAVCGAGKTEAALPLLRQALAAGGRVLWASPRRDVVVELLPRLEAALPGIEVAALHGQVRDRFPRAPLVVATTHQALRLYQAFSLVILDEVDAFPYAHNPMLELAVFRSLEPGGKLVYLTATPTPALLTAVKRGRSAQVLLPLRWHGHPLPEPELLRLRLPLRNSEPWPLPPRLLDLLAHSLAQQPKRILIYVPSVQLAESVGRSLQEYFSRQGTPSLEVEYIHAADGQRDVKRARFFAGLFPVLVTTTLLERGITLANLDVFVLYADSATVFSEAVLMQIAGRAGRAAESPWGRVCFLAENISRTMTQATNQIKNLNRAAQSFLAANPKEDNHEKNRS